MLIQRFGHTSIDDAVGQHFLAVVLPTTIVVAFEVVFVLIQGHTQSPGFQAVRPHHPLWECMRVLGVADVIILSQGTFDQPG